MDFQTIDFDELTDDLESDEALELARKFEDVQEDNLAEFEQASEEIDDLEGRVAEVQEFDSELTDELAEVSPLSEDELENFSVSRKRDLLADFSEEEEEDDGDDDDDEEEGDFSDMGQRGETHNEDEAEKEFAEEYLGGITGLEL